MHDRLSASTSAAGRAGAWLQRALLKPVWTLAALSLAALTIEVCQQWPEFFVPGHAVGEFIRNLAYALIGAVLFNWILIELPAARRRHVAYLRHFLAFQVLVQSGPLMLAWFRLVAKRLGMEGLSLDAWSRESLENFIRAIYEKHPDAVGAERRQMLAVAILGVQTSLDGLEAATYFMDADVAAALAHFPAAKGMNQLQPPEATDPQPWKRDAHITWELLEASRRLYEAFRDCAPDVDLKVEGGIVSLANYLPTESPRLEDLVPAA